MTRRILIVTAVEAEKEAVLRGLRGDSRFAVIAGGVGVAKAAAAAAAAIAAGGFGLAVSAGIGGGFVGRAEVGSAVVADIIANADLGAETQDGFMSIEELGFGKSRIQTDKALSEAWAAALQQTGVRAILGPIVSVSTATGTAETANKLARRIPGACAEGMEGYGVAAAAETFGLPVLEIRTISNAVGPRDKPSWRIADALRVLETASSILTEVIKQ
jgi:futalosine hydrolase